MSLASPEEARLQEIVTRHAGSPGALLPLLHDVQASFGCIPPAAVPVIAAGLNLSRAEVHGVISFYHDFRETPVGERHLKLCRGEACQAMGGDAIAARVLAHFAVDWGGTSANGRVTVSPVFCLGLCSVAPAAQLGEGLVGRVSAATVIRHGEGEP